MSRTRRSPGTQSEKSSWTPKNHVPSNEKIFEERMCLIKKWYAAWSKDQRWSLLEYILMQLDDEQLLLIQSLLEPPIPPADKDFSRILPRFLCLRIFSLLDPQSLCRAAQVCWYWKYLAECNEIWQEKCLRLGWFLPAPLPPNVHDYTLWKRHYIQCVCQLHWNPPQLPAEEEADDGEGEVPEDQDAGADQSKRKKKRAPRHLLSEETRKPWRDPDPHPSDTYYKYGGDISSCLSLYSRFPSLRSKIYNMEPVTPAPVPVPVAVTPPIPAPISLLHPSLMEKLRLGSPTPAHADLNTLNRHQTENEINKILYSLQESSPFPRLPPYFVHQSDEGKGEESERSTCRHSGDQTPPYAPRKRSIMSTTSSPPPPPPPAPKDRPSMVGNIGGKNSRNRDSSSRHKQKVPELELPTKAWNITLEEEDDWP